MESVTLVETPRDAFQGLPKVIPTEEKIAYITSLLDAGIRHIDLASFVSPRVMPQMADSERVVAAFSDRAGIERIAIVPNEQGLSRAVTGGGLEAVGFPFSFSETFQMRNMRKSRADTWPMIRRMIDECEQHKIKFIAYVSMAFGNPYGEYWLEDDLINFVRELKLIGAGEISLADTLALAKPDQVASVFRRLHEEHGAIIGAHFHGRPDDWFDCVEAALHEGCRRFDAAAGGLGGCPFAQDKLVANIPSDKLAQKLDDLGFDTGINLQRVANCALTAARLQKTYGSCGNSA